MYKKKTVSELLDEFDNLRKNNLAELEGLNLSENDIIKTAKHPRLGSVTMKELLSTWAVHDLGHIAQISRVISKQYKSDTGPWSNQLRILN